MVCVMDQQTALTIEVVRTIRMTMNHEEPLLLDDGIVAMMPGKTDMETTKFHTIQMMSG